MNKTKEKILELEKEIEFIKGNLFTIFKWLEKIDLTRNGNTKPIKKE